MFSIISKIILILPILTWKESLINSSIWIRWFQLTSLDYLKMKLTNSPRLQNPIKLPIITLGHNLNQLKLKFFWIKMKFYWLMIGLDSFKKKSLTILSSQLKVKVILFQNQHHICLLLFSLKFQSSFLTKVLFISGR